MDRAQRFCDLCGLLDDHPRHTIDLAPGSGVGVPTPEFLASLAPGAPVSAVAELITATRLVRHQDCCAAAGCELCQATEAIHAGARGADLWQSIEVGKADDLAALDTHGLSIGGLTNG